MDKKPELLYLDLIKKTLSFSLWPEPPLPIETFNYRNHAFKRGLISLSSRFLKRKGLELATIRHHNEGEREEGRIWPGYADTMIGLKRLDNLQSCIETVIGEGIEGDLIETGAWRGGACIFMRAVLAAYGVEDRRVFVADSFEGLPRPDKKWRADRDNTLHGHKFMAISLDEVENNFRRYGLLDDKVVFLQGWFKDTLPDAPIEKLSVLRLDGDMYGSTMDALQNLYPKLSKGGFCIIDDYGAIEGCRKAVSDFRGQYGIETEIHEIDWTGRFWRKD